MPSADDGVTARLRRLVGGLGGAPSMDWLVAGLGNPGARYESTRHNLGRLAVAELARRCAAALDTSRSDTLFGLATVGSARVCLAISLKQMNVSGPGFAAVARYYKVPAERLVVVYDDIDLPAGALRVRRGGGAGGHNGVRSLTQALGTSDFPRVRLGVGRPPAGWDPADYVLAKVAAEDVAVLEETAARGADAVESVVGDGVEVAMNRHN